MQISMTDPKNLDDFAKINTLYYESSEAMQDFADGIEELASEHNVDIIR
ncbi:hypothetical protein PRVXH_000723 [Proteinivorax hydrogeniformans]|uniref:Uncharacterized protein n=1 Tax=Proteinivorax hydrogeniformans TaxID=1826727 RepID=A0AAU8HVI2_9FIRM